MRTAVLFVLVMVMVMVSPLGLPGAYAPESPGSSDSGTNIGVESTYPQINRCEIWNATSYDVDWGAGDDINYTDAQIDVGRGWDYYIYVNVSMASSLSDLRNVSVLGWFDFDNATREDEAYYNATPGPNYNFKIVYNTSSGMAWMEWPTTGEVYLRYVSTRDFGSTIREMAFVVRFGAQVRWAPGDGGWDLTSGYNDLSSWNLFCDSETTTGVSASLKGRAEFGTFRYTTLSVSGNPSGAFPPGSGQQMLGGGNPQGVAYSSNALYRLYVNISDLSGGAGTLGRERIAVEGGDISVPTYFPPGSGVQYLRATPPDWQAEPSSNGSTLSPKWYVDIPLGQAEGAYTSPITYTLEVSSLAVTASAPSSRDYISMAYSPGGSVLMFGGRTAMGPNGETWIYSPTSNIWVLRNPLNTPSARYGYAMTSGMLSDGVGLFGGTPDGLTFNNELWVYRSNTNTWSLETTSGPPPRAMTDLVYAPGQSVAILFGGYGSSVFGDTWRYDPSTKSWIALTPSCNPSCPEARYGHAMSLMPNGKILMFGGKNVVGTLLNDLWEYDIVNNIWTRITPVCSPCPSARFDHAMDTNVSSWEIIMFGGHIGGSDSDETWRYIPGSQAWVLLSPTCVPTCPSARSRHGMAFDPAEGLMVMFGGYEVASGNRRNDTWTYNPGSDTWIRV